MQLAKNRPLPEFIQNKPQLYPWNECIYDGFLELTTCRQYTGFGVAPIPWTAVKEYCDTYGYDILVYNIFIRALDDVYLKAVNAKDEAK